MMLSTCNQSCHCSGSGRSSWLPVGLGTAARHGGKRVRPLAVRNSMERSVFQMSPPRGEASIPEVREAYEACAMYVDKDGRRQCYALFGLDSERVDRYYHTVMDLEKSLSLDDGSDAPAPYKVRSSGVSSFRLLFSLMGAFLSFLFSLFTSIWTVKINERELVHK